MTIITNIQIDNDSLDKLADLLDELNLLPRLFASLDTVKGITVLSITRMTNCEISDFKLGLIIGKHIDLHSIH